MAGSLVQVASETVTSDVSQVDLIGTTTDDVYMVSITGMTCTNGSQTMNYRVLVSSSPDETANYDRAHIDFRLDTGFSDRNASNETSSRIFPSPEIADLGSNAIMYLYNYNLSTQSSILQLTSANRHNSNTSNSEIGGFAHTVSQSCNGIRFFMSSGSISTGTFTLYRCV